MAVPHLAARRRCRGADRRSPCCSSACSTRSARSASCGSASPLFPRRVAAGSRPWSSCSRVIGILYGALLAIGQKRHEAAVAYTSVSHFGFIALGIFAFTSQGGSGATLYMVNHGFSTGALFLVVGFLITPPRLAADRRLRRRAEGRAVLGRHVPGRRPVRLSLPGLSTLRQRVPGAGRHVHRYTGGSRCVATLGIVLAAVYMLGCSSAR